MRIMLDTNILISAGLFPNEHINNLIEIIVTDHELVLPDVVTNEFVEVAAYDKFNKANDAKNFLNRLSYTKYKSPPLKMIENLSIRDDGDYEILFAAIQSGVDIFITGDKDFIESGITEPKMMTISQFISAYVSV